ncbi:MAG: hypothetical protein ACRERE_26770 [Candidatus Entotheonellia bacterium]
METTPPPEKIPAAPPAPKPATWGSVLTVEEVDRIVALADPIIRNLQITQGYQELSLAGAVLIGTVANWCTFATWASKQAGVTIRQEDLARTIERLQGQSPEVQEAIDRVVAALTQLEMRPDVANVRAAIRQVLSPKAAFDRTSDAVARGNQKVFAEIGREFVRFVACFRDDTAFDPEKMARFCEALRPGEPPDGQGYLQRAFRRYGQARFEPQIRVKAELMLLANLEISFHEQMRLQPEIAEALDASIVDPDELKSRILEALYPRPGLFLRLRLFWLRLLGRTSALDRACEQLAARLRDLTRRVITECLMTLALPPDLVLRLGRDVPAEFPEALRQLSDPELQALLARIDPMPDSVRGSGAEDWTDFTDRMHYVADLFRAFQEVPQLFHPPFTPEQVRELKAGRKPDGRL